MSLKLERYSIQEDIHNVRQPISMPGSLNPITHDSMRSSLSVYIPCLLPSMCAAYWLQTLPAQLASIEAREKALQDSDNKLKVLQAEIKELTKQRANLEKEVDRCGYMIPLC